MGGTASSGADYSGANGTLQFAPGETSATITVNIIEDNQNETDESIVIQLDNATGGADTAAPSAATVVIRDNDQPSCSNIAYMPLVVNGGFSGVAICVPSEDSDNVDDAITIASGQRVGSTVNGSDLVDVYRFSVESGTNISLSLSGSGGDADLFLFDPTTTDVWVDPFVIGSTGLTSEEQIDWNADMTGYWYAVVLAYSGSIDYELSLSLGGEFGAAGEAVASSPNGNRLEDYRGTK
jgi:hypothetical protein